MTPMTPYERAAQICHDLNLPDGDMAYLIKHIEAVTVPDIHGAELLQGCGVIRCSQCGCPSVQEPGHDYCQTCARGEIHEVERERDEARAALEEERALNRIAWGVTANVGSQLRTANDVLIPAWQDTTAMLRLWMFAWNLAAAGMSEAIAQRDRRIAELEAALRKMMRLGAEDGVELIRIARAALSAPAQPATPDGNRCVHGSADCGICDNGPSQPATATKETDGMVQVVVRVERREPMTAEEAVRRVAGAVEEGAVGLTLYTAVAAPPSTAAREEAMTTKTVTRNTSTPEAREFWRKAEEAATEVSAWPDWKRAGINTAQLRDEPRPDVSSPAAREASKCRMCGKETREPTKMDGDCLYCPTCVFNRAEMLRHDLDAIYGVMARIQPDLVDRVKEMVDEIYQATAAPTRDDNSSNRQAEERPTLDHGTTCTTLNWCGNHLTPVEWSRFERMHTAAQRLWELHNDPDPGKRELWKGDRWKAFGEALAALDAVRSKEAK